MSGSAGQPDSYIDRYRIAVEKQSFQGKYNAPSVIVTLSIALSLYNSLELGLLISTTFKRWRGLYFWSLCACNAGVIFYTLGMMLGYFKLCILWLNATMLNIGWICMIVCQSLVLYSRLGLILDNARILAAVKWMIVVDCIVLITPTIVLNYGTLYTHSDAFGRGYFYIEHIQVAGFSIQELIISGLYVWKTISLLKVLEKPNTRSVIWQLMVMNFVIIGMDIVLIVLQFKHLQLYQEAIKAFVYSVKLKLELNILSKLVDLVHGDSANRRMTLEIIDANTLTGQARSNMQKEMSGLDRLNSTDKVPQDLGEHGYTDGPRTRASVQPVRTSDEDNDMDGIARVVLPQSTNRYSARTSGRDSDILYADMLRSMK